MRTFKITVSDSDIADGQTCSAYYCPIANAINRNLDCKPRATVGELRVAFGQLKIYLPKEVQDFIRNFDRRNLYLKEYPNTPKPEAFIFYIDIPDDLDCNPITESVL